MQNPLSGILFAQLILIYQNRSALVAQVMGLDPQLLISFRRFTPHSISTVGRGSATTFS
jgi:hypothetical protein